MTIDLLNSYAFILHENIMDLTDEEISIARNFATNYLKKDWKWKEYDKKLNLFVSQQCFKAFTNYNYKDLEKKVFDTLSLVNNVVGVNDWDFNIYYYFEDADKLLLARANENGIYGDIDVIYDIKKNTFSSCKIERTDDMEELGNISQSCYKFREVKTENIEDVDIKI